jgi:hypothetical protein
VTTDAVLTRAEARTGGGPTEWCSWWSAKEALAKALGDARRYNPRGLASPALWHLGRQGRWHARRVGVPTGYFALVVARADPIPSEMANDPYVPTRQCGAEQIPHFAVEASAVGGTSLREMRHPLSTSEE